MHGDEWQVKCARLDARLDEFESLAIAFSGGVDSAVLLAAARARLGPRAFGVIADSPSLARSELAQALEFARAIGAQLEVLATRELEDERYAANRGDRCYFCKSALFGALERWAREHAVAEIAFGEIVDDRFDDRPGRRAAAEFGVVAPLADAQFTKLDVRRWARERALAVAEKPASACLASRIPVGTRVTRERLARVEAAESALRELGFAVLRVRDRAPLAKVELGAEEFERAALLEPAIRERLVACGYAQVEFERYRSPLERAAQR